MKALVTGGGGFLGKAIVKKLLDRGDRARVLGRREYPDLIRLGVETVTGDIQNLSALLNASKGMDVVFHVASKTGIWGRWKDFYGANVTGAGNVIRACKENGISRLVYTSSPSVIYGGEEDFINVDETIPYPKRYNSHYSATKAMAEKMVLSENGNNIRTVSLRPHLIWGPEDTNLIPGLISRAKSGRLIRVGDGKNIVDIVYIDNAAHAHILAADRLEADSPVCGQAYFISQGEPVNLWNWIDKVLSNLNLPPVGKSISYRNAYMAGLLFETVYTMLALSGEPMMTRFLASQLAKSHYFNIEKARNELGYNPVVSHEEGLSRLFDYYRPTI